MNKLAPLFAATMIALSGVALAQDDASSTPSGPSARPDASQGQQGQEAQPKGFVLIQRNIYVPVDEQGNVASQKWVVIDKQGFITAEEMEKAANEAASQESEGSGSDEDAPKADEPSTKPSTGAVPLLQKRQSIGEGPMVRS